MSKNSHRQIYEQLMQWLPTLKNKKKKFKKRNHGKR